MSELALIETTRRETRLVGALPPQRHRPWRPDGFGTAFNRAKIAASMNERNLHFHDLRGTAATKFYIAGFSERAIAEIMGWKNNTLPGLSAAMSIGRPPRRN